MHSPWSSVLSSIAIYTFLYFSKCDAIDSINVSNPLFESRNETLVSAVKRFELGFFTLPGNDRTNSYIGVWYYNINPRTIVWVANRDKPFSGSNVSFGIAEDGNLKIWYSNGTSFPIAENLGNSNPANRTLQLLDSGNLVILDGLKGATLWQSFDNPTNTFLPGMKMTDNMELRSWISSSDPAVGDYTFKQDQNVYTVQKNSSLHWKSGESGVPMVSNDIPSLVSQLLSGYNQESNQTYNKLLENRRNDKHLSYSYTRRLNYSYVRLSMSSSGQIQYYNSKDNGEVWSLIWSEPRDECNIYDRCGKFAICNITSSPICQCLKGFNPVSSGDLGNDFYSEGCERELVNCHSNADKTDHDEFLNLRLSKVGGEVVPFDRAKNDESCKDECLNNCKCKAYSYRTFAASRGSFAAKCLIWQAELENLRLGDDDGSFNLSIRVPPQNKALNKTGQPEDPVVGPKKKSSVRYVTILVASVAGVVIVLCTSYVLCRKRKTEERNENRDRIEEFPVTFLRESERGVNDENDNRGIDVPFYNLDTILSATNNFSDANKLGQGGFGPVYKGIFPGGQEIAVKRLSSFSCQGVKEFQNEVMLIAKLQHRNLVRLLGYCIKENEKILLYEYMPNRSLDSFLFDQTKCCLLDWTKRFNIILGIARGLLYLHQDSRLRIIHRDLKTSNVLLDEEMNPKISDFGLARIVEGKGTEASTEKIVGTFGYMSPEYALEGTFSTKSDVFSFGVVVLEIISGKRNTGFYQPNEVLTLLGYAWRLWSENKALDLADPTLLHESETFDKSLLIKCVNVGLLCVQEDPGDRPNVSNIVIILDGDQKSPLPSPSQPAFVVRKRQSKSTASSSSNSKPDTISNNEATVSIIQGR